MNLETALTGTTLLVLSGVFNGVWPYPMRFAHEWEWENIWFTFVIFGLLLFPSIGAILTVPNLWQVYSSVSTSTLLLSFGLGIAWGLGSLTFGLGIAALGLSLGYAIIIGTAALLGTLVPALVLEADSLGGLRSLLVVSSLVCILLGLVSCGIAGKKREDRQKATLGNSKYHITEARLTTHYSWGLTIAILSGVFSACFNIGFAFAGEVSEKALASGASQGGAASSVWALIMGAGALPSALYCGYLFLRNGSFGMFNRHRVNWLLGVLMGGMWIVGINLYGAGVLSVGSAGATLGWPIMLSTTIVTANIVGIACKEWEIRRWEIQMYLYVGIFLLLFAVVLASLASDP